MSTTLVREMLGRGRPFRDETRGHSMAPSIPAGSEIEVHEVDRARLYPGDVVLADFGGRLVAHRVLVTPRENRRAVLKGDRNPRADRPLAGERVIGIVVAARRPGEPWRSLRTPAARLRALGWAVASPWLGVAVGLRRSAALKPRAPRR